MHRRSSVNSTSKVETLALDSTHLNGKIVESIMLTDQARTAFLALSLEQISSQQQQLSHQLAILRRLRRELDIEKVLTEELNFEMPRKRRPIHDQILKIIDEAGVNAAEETQAGCRGHRVVK